MDRAAELAEREKNPNAYARLAARTADAQQAVADLLAAVDELDATSKLIATYDVSPLPPDVLAEVARARRFLAENNTARAGRQQERAAARDDDGGDGGGDAGAAIEKLDKTQQQQQQQQQQ